MYIVRFHAATSGSRVYARNIAEWEDAFWKYDPTRLDSLRGTYPDLLVVRNAENVNPNSANAHDFSNHLDRLISYSGDRSETKMVAFDGLQDSSVVGPLE